MRDTEHQPGPSVRVDEIGAAILAYNASRSRTRESAWVELWRARDFTWDGRSENAALQTITVKVPASFPDGRDVDGEFKTVTLKEYWRWSIGLPGKDRLMTDAELRDAGLLVDVNGVAYHILHRPGLVGADEGSVGREGIIAQVIAARVEGIIAGRPTDEIVTSHKAAILNLSGCWLQKIPKQALSEHVTLVLDCARVSEASFKGVQLADVNCHETLFNGSLEAEEFCISGRCNFTSCTFMDKVRFASGVIHSEANFEKSVFVGHVDFTATHFLGIASFEDAVFEASSVFGGLTELGETDFEATRFHEEAYFPKAKFLGSADFSSIQFFGMVDFSTAKFSRDAKFVNSVFSNRALFSGCEFATGLRFIGTTFHGVCSFRSVHWPKGACDNAFNSTRFMDRVDFSNTSLPIVSAFNETRFDIEPIIPDDPEGIRSKKLFKYLVEQTKTAIRIDKSLQKQEKRTENQFRRPSKDERWAALSGGYRTLKTLAERKGDFELVQIFYRFEVQSRTRRPSVSGSEKLITGFYGASSDYGNSMLRPFLSLGILLFMFAAVYAALAAQVGLMVWSDPSSVKSSFLQGLRFSLNNFFHPLSVLSIGSPADGEGTDLAGQLLNNYGLAFGLVVTVVSIVQSIIGVALAFLFGLAVRRRFQIS